MLNLKKLEYALTKDSLCDAERVSEALAIVRDARRSSPSQVAPANPAQVTDAVVTKALSAFEKDHPHNRAAMRAALTAAIGAGGQAVACPRCEGIGSMQSELRGFEHCTVCDGTGALNDATGKGREN